ncbi:type IV secretory system conjugative DNA transfer family protein [Microvirga sp. VF16]|uniref:type IV secretory system conjugative DNA transfer family protein n=1 Tax=Microvirga sp. VF16 TaxID=2807101 RepID=UPI00193D9712|nr:type IV secretory system conjugative DNA transfer family protein [Microvirga sp. VF16]QRM35508.1 type IV secretory system conjugative DNA transfer family protein [Microvirga sp. VF16]
MKDLLKKLFGLGLSKDAIIAPHGALLTLGEDRRGVPHGTTRNANTLLLGASSRQRVERVIVPTLLRGTSASYIVDDPTGEVYDLTAATRAKLGPVSRIRWHNGSSYNPLADINLGADPETRSRRLHNIAETFISQWTEGYDRIPEIKTNDGNDTIEQEAISALWGLLELATAQVANAGGLRLAEPTLMGLYTGLIEHRLDDKAADYVAAADNSGSPRALFELRTYAALSDERRRVIHDAIMQRLAPFHTPETSWASGDPRGQWAAHRNISTSEAVEISGPATVYVCCPTRHGPHAAAYNLLTRHLWQQIIDEAIHGRSEQAADKPQRPAVFIFTNTDQAEPISGMTTLAAAAKKTDLSILVSADDAASLDRLYGPANAEALKAAMDLELDFDPAATRFMVKGPEKPILRPSQAMGSFLLPAPRDF